MQIQCTVTNDTHKDNIPFTTTIVVTNGSVVKPYTCHHKTITRMSYNVMGPVTLLHRALLQRPFLGGSKAPFLTNSVSHLELEAKAGAATFFKRSLNKHIFAGSK